MSFGVDFGTSPPEPKEGTYQDGEGFGLSVFLREGDDVYRTYFTAHRGVEGLGTVWSLLDITPFAGRRSGRTRPTATRRAIPTTGGGATIDTRRTPDERARRL